MLICLMIASLSINIVSASYVILKFSSNGENLNNINMYVNHLKDTTNSLNETSRSLIQTKNDSAMSNAFINSFTSSNTLNPLLVPPFTDIGQIYWDTSLKTLISTDGSSKYVWVGSIWMLVTANNTVVGTNQSVTMLISKHPGQLPSNDLQINRNGNIAFNVSVSNIRGSINFLPLSINIALDKYNSPIFDIHWDANYHGLIGTTNKNRQVIYSVFQDKTGSYWSNAILLN